MGRQRVPVERPARARQAREDARAFVSGLYEGDGRPAQGAVFVIGVMHGTKDASAYKTTMKSWLGDAPFWLDMQRTVRFWAQEVYGDARRWGVPGAAPEARREYLNDFLQHAAKLGAVAPNPYGAARAFLSYAHTPIGNAGWQVAGRARLDDGLGRPDAALRVVAELCASQLRLDEIRARPLRVRLGAEQRDGLRTPSSSPRPGSCWTGWASRCGTPAASGGSTPGSRPAPRSGSTGAAPTWRARPSRTRGGSSTWNEPRATGPGVNRRLVTTVRTLARRVQRTHRR